MGEKEMIGNGTFGLWSLAIVWAMAISMPFVLVKIFIDPQPVQKQEVIKIVHASM